MIKLFNKICLFIFFSFFIIVFLTNSNLIISTVNKSLNTFINTLVPSLFPFFILADILINYNYLYFLEKIFKLKYSNVILLSMISGLPSNAKYISYLLDNKAISLNDAERLLSITFFPSPMFVLGVISSIIKVNTLPMLLIVYLSNFIMYFIFYKNLKGNNIEIMIEKKRFPSLLKFSILKTIENLIIILGTIVTFNIIINVISQYCNFNPFITAIINSFLEMTSSVERISILNYSPYLKYIFITATLSFSGLSIIMQALSILNEYKLNFFKIIKNKLIITLISLLLTCLYFLLI